MVFQDPQASLNPRKRVARSSATPLRIAASPRDEFEPESRELLARSGSTRSTSTASRTSSPAASGSASGSPARWPSSRADLLDEPVSALDVSIQAQVINLLGDLQEEFELSLRLRRPRPLRRAPRLDRIAVMYLGKLVELSPAEELYDKPIHPYTLGAARRDPDPGPAREPRPRAADSRGRAAEPDQPAARLPLPHALPAREGDLPATRAAADRVRGRPSRRLPLPADVTAEEIAAATRSQLSPLSSGTETTVSA